MTQTIAILGGTGAEGHGLARRFVQAGRTVIVGSRQAERAHSTAAGINQELGSGLARGTTNREAANAADLMVLTIPYEGMAETVKPLASALTGKTVISTIVPLEFVRGVARLLPAGHGSAAQELQGLLPEAKVVAAFHHLSAPMLMDLSQSVDADVLVCSDDVDAKQQAMALAETLPGARGVDAGPLESALYLEAFTALLLRINRRYKAHAGVRITHLPSTSLAPAPGESVG